MGPLQRTAYDLIDLNVLKSGCYLFGLFATKFIERYIGYPGKLVSYIGRCLAMPHEVQLGFAA
jgi:hypothetical protein